MGRIRLDQQHALVPREVCIIVVAARHVRRALVRVLLPGRTFGLGLSPMDNLLQLLDVLAA